MLAADALVLYPVLRTRLRRWACDANESGFVQLELQLGITQQLLDTAVKAVYARQLTVGPESVEGLLLLADYLLVRLHPCPFPCWLLT